MMMTFSDEEPLSTVQRLRLEHHFKAMTVATLDLSEEFMARYLQMTVERLRVLKADPTFQELVAHYRQRWSAL